MNEDDFVAILIFVGEGAILLGKNIIAHWWWEACCQYKALKRKFEDAAETRAYEAHRSHALFRASNGEHLTKRERFEYDLPDWTA